MASTKREFSRQTVIILVVLVLLFGLVAGALAADARLSAADANLEKAAVLVEAARDVTGELDEKPARAYDRALAKANDDIARARQHIADAIAIADAP